MTPNDVHSVSFPRGVTDTITNCFMISVQLQMQPCKGDWKPLFHSVMYPYMPVHEHTSPSAPDRLLMCTVNFHNVLKDVRNYFKTLLIITVIFYTVLQIAEIPWKLTYAFILYLPIKHRIIAYRLAQFICLYLKTLCKVIAYFCWGDEKANTAPVSLCYMLYFYKNHINEIDIMGDHSQDVFPLSRIWLM